MSNITTQWLLFPRYYMYTLQRLFECLTSAQPFGRFFPRAVASLRLLLPSPSPSPNPLTLYMMLNEANKQMYDIKRADKHCSGTRKRTIQLQHTIWRCQCPCLSLPCLITPGEHCTDNERKFLIHKVLSILTLSLTAECVGKPVCRIPKGLYNTIQLTVTTPQCAECT